MINITRCLHLSDCSQEYVQSVEGCPYGGHWLVVEVVGHHGAVPEVDVPRVVLKYGFFLFFFRHVPLGVVQRMSEI